MLKVLRTESPYSYPRMFSLGLCEKKYLYSNFTNAFTASVIFLMSHSNSPPLTPLQKGLNLGERPNPLFHVCESVESECINKKIKIYTAKINLPLGQAWLLLSILFDVAVLTISQKNIAYWNDRNHTSFIPSHELEVAFKQTSQLPTLFIFSPTIQRCHNWYLYF